MKTKVHVCIIMVLVLIVASNCLTAQPAGWQYGRSYIVNENSATDVYNYQLKMIVNTAALVTAGEMDPTGKDIRFAKDCFGIGLYDYWIEAFMNTDTTIIWVKIDTLLASSQKLFYMFWGNSFAPPVSTINIFMGPNSATDSVVVTSTNTVSNCQRGFRFIPQEDVLVTDFGKREPSGTNRFITLFDFNTTNILAQIQVSGPAGQYSYAPLANPLWLKAGVNYVIEQYNSSTDTYYYGSSTQIGTKLTYVEMRYANSCTENTFPNNTLTSMHYGCPDFWYYIKNTVTPAPTYTPGLLLSVGITALPAIQCENDQPLILDGSPAGGVFSGSGVTGNLFDPSLSGWGNQDVYYSYTFGPGCVLSDTATIFVSPLVADFQIQTADSVLCEGDSTVLTFINNNALSFDLPTQLVGSNSQDGNMFDVQAGTLSVTIKSFEAAIENLPNPTTEYYIYYKAGAYAGFEGNASAWTLLAGPVTITPNAFPALTPIPVPVNITIPAGQTYAFYLTNTSASANNNRYHNGTLAGQLLAQDSSLKIFEGIGKAYPFGTTFNPRCWEGRINYEVLNPPVDMLWSTGDTTASITVAPSATTDYSLTVNYGGTACLRIDSINVLVDIVNADFIQAIKVCENGDSVVLSGGTPAGGTYSGPGVTGTSFDPALAGSGSWDLYYSVTSLNGCMASDTNTVIVDTIPNVTLSILDPSYCLNSAAVTLVMTPTGGSLTGDGLTGNVIDFLTAGTGVHDYVYSFTDGNTCSNSDTTTTEVFAVPIVTLGGLSSLYCIYSVPETMTGSPAGGVFSGPGVSGNVFNPATAGNGNHQITYIYSDVNGCADTATFSLTVDPCIGISPISGGLDFSIQPNPNNGVFTVTNPQSDGSMTYRVVNVLGETVFLKEKANDIEEISIPSIASGMYYFIIETDGRQFSRKFMIQH